MSSPPVRLRILIAAGHPEAAHSLAALVCSWGDDPVVTFDGTVAVALALGRPPDVALVDLALPSPGGLAVARALRGNPDLRAALVALGRAGGEPCRQGAVEAGFDFSWDLTGEPEALRRILDGRRPPQAPLTLEQLAGVATSLASAADLVEAIDDPALRTARGWRLEGWSYELVPWGVRFFQADDRGEVRVLLPTAGTPGHVTSQGGQVVPASAPHAPGEASVIGN